MTFVLTGLDIEAKAELAERTLWSLDPRRPRGVRRGRRAAAAHRPRRPGHQRRRPRRAAHHGHGPGPGQGRPGLLEHGHRDGAGQLPGPVHHLAPGRRLELRGLLAGAGARRRSRTTRWCSDGERIAHRAGAGRRAVARPARADDAEPTATSAPHGGPSTCRARSTPPDAARDEPDDRGRRWAGSFGARSGDKGGNANIGVWARTDDAYVWLHRYLTVERLRELMPAETDGLEVRALRAAQPAGPQLRDRGPARPGRRRLDPHRPAGQGPRRVPAGQGGRDPDHLLLGRDGPAPLDHLPRRPSTAEVAMQFTAEHELFRKTVRDVRRARDQPAHRRVGGGRHLPGPRAVPQARPTPACSASSTTRPTAARAPTTATPSIYGEEVGRCRLRRRAHGHQRADRHGHAVAAPLRHPRAEGAVPRARPSGARWWPPSP